MTSFFGWLKLLALLLSFLVGYVPPTDDVDVNDLNRWSCGLSFYQDMNDEEYFEAVKNISKSEYDADIRLIRNNYQEFER